MKQRFRIIRRNIRGGTFYCVDTLTGKRASLGTADENEATELVHAKNQATRQPILNLHIAKAYLAGSDSGITTRTWQHAINHIIDLKQGVNHDRWIRAAREKPFDLIRNVLIVETPTELLLRVLRTGTISTNVFLRRIHNFCLDMNWLPWPIIPKRQWPPVRHKDKRAITLVEHMGIVARESSPERKAFYQLAWYTGASQSDIASLRAEDIDWENRLISYARHKTGQIARVRFSEVVEDILRGLPDAGPLFPRLIRMREAHRATEFKRHCNALGIQGVTLHSYRYAWAERARKAGYPERWAQEALGHNSKAVHRAYAKHARVEAPSLDEWIGSHAGHGQRTEARQTKPEVAVPANSLPVSEAPNVLLFPTGQAAK